MVIGCRLLNMVTADMSSNLSTIPTQTTSWITKLVYLFISIITFDWIALLLVFGILNIDMKTAKLLEKLLLIIEAIECLKLLSLDKVTSC